MITDCHIDFIVWKTSRSGFLRVQQVNELNLSAKVINKIHTVPMNRVSV
jgi:hypothetical protein